MFKDASRPRKDTLQTVLLALCGLALVWHDLQIYDVWWHLASGRWILEHGVPTVDPFSFGFPGGEWIEHHWLYDVLAWKLFGFAGANGLIVMKTVALALAFALFLRVGRGAPRGVVLFAVALAILTGNERFVVRAEVFTLLGLLWTLHVTTRARDGAASRAELYSLPVVQLLWVQLHGLWILGPVVQGIFLAVDLLPALPAPFAASRELVRRRGGVLLASLAVALLNPYGIRGALFPFFLFTELGGDHPIGSLIGEFASPFSSLHFAGDLRTVGYLAAIAFSAGAFVVARRRIDAALLLLWIAFAALSTMALRNVALFGYVAAFCVIRLAVGQPDVFKRWNRLGIGVALAAAVALPLIVSNVFYLHQGRDERFGLGVSDRKYPIRPLQFMRDEGLPLPAIHGLGDGGYVLFEGGAGSVYVDGRLEVYGADNLTRAIRLSQHGEGLQEETLRTGTRSVIVRNERRDLGLLQRLEADPAWAPVYCDPRHVVYVARNAVAPARLERLSLDWERPRCNTGSAPPEHAAPRGLPRWWPTVREAFDDERLGTLFVAVGRYGPALEAFQRAFERAPGSERTRLHLGLLYRAQGRDEFADAMLAPVPRSMLEAIDTQTFAGQAALWAGNPAAALEPLQRAVEGGAADPAATRRLVRALIELQRFDDARQRLDELVERMPRETSAWNARAALAAGQGRRDDARRDFERSLEIDPDQPRVREALRSLRESGQGATGGDADQ